MISQPQEEGVDDFVMTVNIDQSDNGKGDKKV